MLNYFYIEKEEGFMAEGHRNRVRKKVENYDIDVLEDHELIELLLFPFIPRKDVNPLAHKLLDSFGSLKGVLQADPNDLRRFPNMTQKAALYLPLFLKVAARANSSEVLRRGKGSNPKTVAEFITHKLRHEKFEQLYVIALDGHDRISNIKKLSTGDDTSVAVDSIALVEFSIAEKSKRLVVAHNHPVDSPYPSKSDIEVTAFLAETLKRLNIILSDHVIVSNGVYFSFRMENLLENGEFVGDVDETYIKNNYSLRSITDFEENEEWKK